MSPRSKSPVVLILFCQMIDKMINGMFGWPILWLICWSWEDVECCLSFLPSHDSVMVKSAAMGVDVIQEECSPIRP